MPRFQYYWGRVAVAAHPLLHDQHALRYLSASVPAAKSLRRQAAVAAEKAAKISRVLEPQLARDAVHGAGQVHEPAARLQCQALLDQIEAGASGQSSAQPIQTGFGKTEPAGVALHRPMFRIVRLHEHAELPQPLEVRTAVCVAGRGCRGGEGDRPERAAGQTTADGLHPHFRLSEFMQQTFKLLRCARRQRWVEPQIDGPRHRKQRLDRRLQPSGRNAHQSLKIDRQYIALRVRSKAKTMNGSGRYDHDRRAVEARLGLLEHHSHRPGSDQNTLAKNRVPMSPDSPQVLSAARLNILNVQGISICDGNRLFAVQREARDLATYGLQNAPRREPRILIRVGGLRNFE